MTMRVLLEQFDVRVSVAYAVMATLWIVVSDGLLMALSSRNLPLAPAVGLVKGLGFVAVTTICLYIIVSREWRRRMQVEKTLQEDITKRMRLQEAQEQHVRVMDDMRQFLQATLDAFPANAVVLDVDGTIISFNAAWKHFALANGAQGSNYLLGTNYLAVCDAARGPYSAEAAPAAAAIRAVITGRQDSAVIEYPCHSPQESRWFALRVTPLDEPAPRRVVVAHLDITERWKAEQALQKAYDSLEQRIVERTAELRSAKERVEALLNNSADGILLVNFDLSIHQSNLSFCTLFGCEANGYSGASFETLAHPEDAVLLAEAATAVVANHQPQGVQFRARRRDGSLFDAELTISYVTSEGLVVTVRDVTERRQADEALRQALAKESELSELKSRFVAMASHEFRTPLATILATADTLTAYRERMDDDQIGEKLGIIREQVGVLRDIMEDLLRMARMEARRAEFCPIELNPDLLCREVVEEYRSYPGATHRLMYSCGPLPPRVSLDKKLMRQIVSNLVSNAIKFSEASKTVTVRLEQDGNALVLLVRDEGLGIPDVDLKYLFKPFYRATNVGTIKGIGLGLVIAKESVDLHNGTIHVESKVGVGTTFTVRIPIVHAKEP